MTRFLKILAVLFSLIMVFILAFSLLLKTDIAQEKTTMFVEELILEELGLNAKISGLNLSFPLVAKVKNISLYDQENEIIIIKDFSIDILPSLFSFWKITISSLSVDELHILRIPNIKTKDTQINSKPLFNPDINVKQMSVSKLILDKILTNRRENIVANLKSSLFFDGKKQQLSFDLVNKLLLPNPDMLGNNSLAISGVYNIQTDQIKLDSIKFQSDVVEVVGSYLMDKLNDQILGQLQYKSNILEKVISKNFAGTTSKLNGNIKIFGKLEAPQIKTSGNLSIDLPQNDYFKFSPLSWDSNLTLSENNIDGEINLSQNEITATGRLGYKNGQIYLQKFKARAPNFEKTANVTFDIDNFIVKGEALVKDTTLKTTAETFPFINNGSIDFNVVFSSLDNKKQQVNIKSKIKQLSTKFANCGLADVDLKIEDLWSLKLSDSKLRLDSLNIDNNIISKVELNAYSNDNDINLNGSITANNSYPVDLNFISSLAVFSDQFSINISDLSGSINSVPVKNSTDININFQKTNSVKLNDFKVGNGVMNISAEFSKDFIKANTDLKNIHMNILPKFLPKSFKHSEIDGTISMFGSVEKPTLKSNISINKIAIQNISDKLSCNIDVNIQNNETKIQSEFFEQSGKISNLSATLPVKFSLSPFKYTIDEKRSFSASLVTFKNFDLLSMLPVPIGVTVNGSLQGDIRASGSINDPQLFGNIIVTNGEFQYPAYGLLLKDINTTIIANKNQISFDKLIAHDRFNNKLIASGEASLDGNKNFSLNIKTDKFNLINTSYLQGKVKGNLIIKGDKSSAVSKGDLVLGPMEIKIPEHFQQDIPKLNISKIIQADNKVTYSTDKPYKLELDIGVKTAKKVYIRGWGVDSGLKGSLRVTGSAKKPVINGALNSIRGKYQEFGKLLKIKRGVVNFDGPIPPSPYINIVGVINIENNEIRLILSGPIKKPDITIESTPDMTQEQALSMLLFGKDVKNISTFQALQLVDGVRRLSGHGGGFDPLGLGKEILGVDNINFKSDPDNPENTSVGVGKHLSNKVYFEVESGSQEESTKTKIEVQVTPNISIENIIKQEGNSAVGINWRFDY